VFGLLLLLGLVELLRLGFELVELRNHLRQLFGELDERLRAFLQLSPILFCFTASFMLFTLEVLHLADQTLLVEQLPAQSEAFLLELSYLGLDLFNLSLGAGDLLLDACYRAGLYNSQPAQQKCIFD